MTIILMRQFIQQPQRYRAVPYAPLGLLAVLQPAWSSPGHLRQRVRMDLRLHLEYMQEKMPSHRHISRRTPYLRTGKVKAGAAESMGQRDLLLYPLFRPTQKSLRGASDSGETP